MKRLLCVFALALFLSAPVLAQVTVAGVKYAPTARVGAAELALNGAGVRSKYFFSVYTIALYLPARSDATATIMNEAGPKRMEIVMLRAMTGEQFADALVKAMRKNHNDEEMARIQARLDRFSTTLLGLKKAEAGTRIFMDWEPDVGTVLTINGQRVGEPVPGDDFYQGLLRIWIGDRPTQDDLKAMLLGKRA